MRNLLLLLLGMLASPSLFSQSKLNPTQDKAKIIVQLRDFGDRPVPKARIRLQALEKSQMFEARTNKKGWCELLVPKGKPYLIHVEDSLDYEVLNVQDKPFLMVRRKVFYQGAVKGKLIPTPERPLFAMKPPPEGMAMLKLKFEGLDRKPLKGESITVTGIAKGETFSRNSNAKGEAIFNVPVGETYRISLKHRKNLDEFEFPRRGGSYRVHSRYVYAGAVAIDAARAERRRLDSTSNPWKYSPAYQAWKALNDSLLQAGADEEELQKSDALRRQALQNMAGDTRDDKFHKKEFREITVRPVTQDYTLVDKPYGYDVKMKSSAKVNSPFYMDGKLFTGGGYNSSKFYCIDPVSGKADWSIGLGEGGPAMVSGGEGHVAVCTESCTIYVVDAKTGKLAWSRWLTYSLRSSPTIADGRLYIGYQDDDGGFLYSERESPLVSLACFDVKTGELLWQQWLDDEVISAPVAAEGAIYCATYGGTLYKMDPASGEILASHAAKASSAPTIHEGEVIISQRGPDLGVAQERISVLDAKDLGLKRSSYYQAADYLTTEMQMLASLQRRSLAEDMSNGLGDETAYNGRGTYSRSLVGLGGASALLNFQGSRVLVYKDRYYLTMGNQVLCYDSQLEKVRWRYAIKGVPVKSGGHSASPPLQAGGYLIVTTVTGKVLVLDPKNGALASSWDTGLSHRLQAVVMDGNIFAPSTEGRIAVIRNLEPGMTGWAAFGGSMQRDNRNQQK